MRTDFTFLLTRIVNVLLGMVAFFLGFRFLFQLFGANPQTPFVSWIYHISTILLFPFQSIFPQQDMIGSSTFDIIAIIALVIYTFFAQLLLTGIDRLRSHALHTREHEHAV